LAGVEEPLRNPIALTVASAMPPTSTITGQGDVRRMRSRPKGDVFVVASSPIGSSSSTSSTGESASMDSTSELLTSGSGRTSGGGVGSVIDLISGTGVALALARRSGVRAR
jgi:hypothetical protein